MNGGWGISYEIALRWMPLDLTDGKSTLAQVMACCRTALSHYLSQCWPSSLLPYGVTRPQWVNSLRPRQNGCHFPANIFKCIFFNNSLVPSRRQAIIWTYEGLVYWWIYVSLRPQWISPSGIPWVTLCFCFGLYSAARNRLSFTW